MQRRTILTSAALGVAGAALKLPGLPPPGIYAIRGVTVVDALGGVRRGQTVLIRADRILDAGPAHRVPVPHGATIIDGAGKYLIPGLADMHTHATGIDDTDPELYVVNGVTTTRQMSGSAQARDWQQQIAAGGRIGPQWSIGSRILDGSPSLWDGPDAAGYGHAHAPAPAPHP